MVIFTNITTHPHQSTHKNEQNYSFYEEQKGNNYFFCKFASNVILYYEKIIQNTFHLPPFSGLYTSTYTHKPCPSHCGTNA